MFQNPESKEERLRRERSIRGSDLEERCHETGAGWRRWSIESSGMKDRGEAFVLTLLLRTVMTPLVQFG